MTYRPSFDEKRGWRVVADYTAEGGTVVDIGGAINEAVACKTAFELQMMNRMAAKPLNRRAA